MSDWFEVGMVGRGVPTAARGGQGTARPTRSFRQPPKSRAFVFFLARIIFDAETVRVSTRMTFAVENRRRLV